MNEQLKTFAKEHLASNLAKLPTANQRIFKLMYGRNAGKRSVADAEAMHIESILNEIPDCDLDWAMQQVLNTIDKIEKERGRE